MNCTRKLSLFDTHIWFQWSFFFQPELVYVFVFVLNVNVKTGVVCDVEPIGTAFAVLYEQVIDDPLDDA